MTTKETPQKSQPAQAAREESQPRKSRKKGYRGYPNKPAAGVHFGTGFAGAGSTAPTGSAGLPAAGVVSERTREDAKKD